MRLDWGCTSVSPRISRRKEEVSGGLVHRILWSIGGYQNVSVYVSHRSRPPATESTPVFLSLNTTGSLPAFFIRSMGFTNSSTFSSASSLLRDFHSFSL